MEQYIIKNHNDFSEWEKLSLFVENHPEKSVFQSPEIFFHYQKTKNYFPFLFVVYENKNIVGSLIGVTQKESKGVVGFLSSRSIINGGPLVFSGNKNADLNIAKLLIKSSTAYLKSKCMYIQYRNMFSLVDIDSHFKSFSFHYDEHLNYLVHTEDEAITRKKVSKSKLRQIKTGIKNKAVMVEPESLEEVREFYSILKNLYKNKVKKPLPDWSFFENFYHQSTKGSLGKYFLIKDEKSVLGGIMCPISFNDKIHEWYIASVPSDSKKQYPGVLSTWAPIQYGIDHGFKYFDFMGAGKPDEAYGVREFKEKFGGELVNYGRYERINRPLLYKLVRSIYLKINK